MNDTSKPISGCPVMSHEEIVNLEDAMFYDGSSSLERLVREHAARCAETCLAIGAPARCWFMAPLSHRDIMDGDRQVAQVTAAHEVTVDVRGAKGFAAVLIAEEQIRRQLAKLPWTILPDLAASR